MKGIAMLSNTTLFFLILVPAVLSTGFLQPHLTRLINSIGYDGTRKALYLMSAVHWIFGVGLLFYFAPSDLPSWGNMFNHWENIAVVAFQTFLGHRYAQLASWVKQKGQLRESIRKSIRAYPSRHTRL